MSKIERILLVLVHYGDRKITQSAINSIREGEIVPEIAVICSKREVKDLLKENVIIIEDEKNYGYSSRLNIAIDYAIENHYDYLILANNDILVDKKTVSGLFKYISNKGGIILGPLILRENGTVESAGIRINLLTGRHYQLFNGKRREDLKKGIILPDAIAGTFMMMGTDIIKRMRFDETFDFYFEDVCFCLRVREAGIGRPVVLTDFSITHRGSSSIKGLGQRRIASMVTGNHLRVIKRFSLLKDSRLKILPLTSVVLLNLLYFVIRVGSPVEAIVGVISGAIRELSRRDY